MQKQHKEKRIHKTSIFKGSSDDDSDNDSWEPEYINDNDDELSTEEFISYDYESHKEMMKKISTELRYMDKNYKTTITRKLKTSQKRHRNGTTYFIYIVKEKINDESKSTTLVPV
jgi:hypothetical protein